MSPGDDSIHNNCRQEWFNNAKRNHIRMCYDDSKAKLVTINGSCSRSSKTQGSGTLSRHWCHRACQVTAKKHLTSRPSLMPC
eukprot:11034590-Karenia_brevis.AAC.1